LSCPTFRAGDSVSLRVDSFKKIERKREFTGCLSNTKGCVDLQGQQGFFRRYTAALRSPHNQYGRKRVKTKSLVLAFILVSVCFANGARAWDAAGHMQVADIAWTRLNDRAKKEITTILMEGDPKFRPVSLSEADVRDAFRKASTFPDVIKGNRNTSYEEIIGTMNVLFFVTTKPDPNDNEDNLCKTWHYYDIPIHDKGKHAPKESNALAALTRARAELARLEHAAMPDRKMQCWWLYWIEHVVGDLHQPLHCVSNYAIEPEGDAGGNKFMIQIPGRSGGRLHGYWDGGIARAVGVDREQGLSPNVEEVSMRWITENAPSRSAASDLKVMSWIKAGAALADKAVYQGIEPDQAPSAEYEKAQIALCKRQAVLGGYRLAALLNGVLGK
jgi:hypothetical protein